MTRTPEGMASITAAPVIADTSTMDRAAWLDLRHRGLGGSDAAAVLGLSRWTSAYELWLDKTGQRPDDDASSTRLRAGQHLESFVVAEAQLARPGLTITNAPYMLRHPDHEELLADLDGIARDGAHNGWGVFEAKTVSPFMGAEWDDGVPVYYEAQVAHYLAVTGLGWAVVAALIGLDRLAVHVIERDEGTIEALVAAELEWWQRHVVEGKPPAVDGSKAATEVLSLIEARSGAVKVLDLDDEAEVRALFRQAAHDKAVADEATAGLDLAKNTVRQMLGEHTELEGHDGTRWATWRPGKPKTSTNWQAAAERAALALGVPLDDLAAPHTTTNPGPRVLRIDGGLKQIAKENA